MTKSSNDKILMAVRIPAILFSQLEGACKRYSYTKTRVIKEGIEHMLYRLEGGAVPGNTKAIHENVRVIHEKPKAIHENKNSLGVFKSADNIPNDSSEYAPSGQSSLTDMKTRLSLLFGQRAKLFESSSSGFVPDQQLSELDTKIKSLKAEIDRFSE